MQDDTNLYSQQRQERSRAGYCCQQRGALSTTDPWPPDTTAQGRHNHWRHLAGQVDPQLDSGKAIDWVPHLDGTRDLVSDQRLPGREAVEQPPRGHYLARLNNDATRRCTRFLVRAFRSQRQEPACPPARPGREARRTLAAAAVGAATLAVALSACGPSVGGEGNGSPPPSPALLRLLVSLPGLFTPRTRGNAHVVA